MLNGRQQISIREAQTGNQHFAFWKVGSRHLLSENATNLTDYTQSVHYITRIAIPSTFPKQALLAKTLATRLLVAAFLQTRRSIFLRERHHLFCAEAFFNYQIRDRGRIASVVLWTVAHDGKRFLPRWQEVNWNS